MEKITISIAKKINEISKLLVNSPFLEKTVFITDSGVLCSLVGGELIIMPIYPDFLEKNTTEYSLKKITYKEYLQILKTKFTTCLNTFES